jgi:hypothetical protein
VTADFARCNLSYNENMIMSRKKEDYKSLIRKCVKEAAFKELKVQQESHSKVKTIIYDKLEKQSYLDSPLFSNEDVGILSNLRSHTTRTIRANFKKLYRNNTSCPLKCWPTDSTPLEDTQEHLLVCSKLQLRTNMTVASGKIEYVHIYGSVCEQKEIVTTIKELLHERNILLESNPTSGISLDPSTPQCYANTPVTFV